MTSTVTDRIVLGEIKNKFGCIGYNKRAFSSFIYRTKYQKLTIYHFFAAHAQKSHKGSDSNLFLELPTTTLQFWSIVVTTKNH